MKLLVRGGRIIDPAQGWDTIGSILINDGRIAWLGESLTPPGVTDFEVFPAAGLVVCPGFIDLHCHLRQPGNEDKETIATGTLAAAKGGFTTVCCMPNTDPPLATRSAIEQVNIIAGLEGVIRVLPIGCISMGRKGMTLAPMDEMARAGAVAFSDDGSPVMSSGLMRHALERSLELNMPVINHCEDITLTFGGQVNEGAISHQMQVRGIPAAAEEIMVARDLMLAGLTGGHLHLAHISTAGSVELIRQAREKGIKFTAEVTPHHITLTEETVLGYNADARVNPPLRTQHDTEVLAQALNDGLIDIIATDHAPHTAADKSGEFSRTPFGISGLETALGSLMTLVRDGKISLNTLISKLTAGPAHIIGRSLGTLEIGAPADITIFDPAREWVVDTRNFASRGRNTPLDGAVLKGKVTATIFNGEIVYREAKGEL